MGTFQMSILLCNSSANRHLPTRYVLTTKELSNGLLYKVLSKGGSEISGVKILSFQIHLIKSVFFETFDFRVFVILTPLEIKLHTVPHLKTLNKVVVAILHKQTLI